MEDVKSLEVQFLRACSNIGSVVGNYKPEKE